MGKKLKLMSNFFLYGQEAVFFGEFRNNTRFKLATENSQHSLTISDLRVSDSATYYCMGSNFFEFEFYDGTTVIVKGLGSNVPASIRWLASSTIQPEDAAMPNCTVHTGICNEGHSVYSFRTSGESGTGLIYTTRGRNTKNNHAKTCFYNLPAQNLNGSQTQTDYCAVAACGQILFENETKLEFEDSPVLVNFLRGASAFSTFLAVCLAFSVCLMNNRHSCHCNESNERRTLLSRPKTCRDGLRNRMQTENTWTQCLYFTAKDDRSQQTQISQHDHAN
uniref:Immunoglobulin V-set domain-containing protein n=1 Tax=Tetraodon nigroviridis TaxID=99883 RepID=H3C6D9_TETNG